jgi:hypothetical protein
MDLLMASGDVVNGFLPSSTWTTFQPALSVEVVITAVLGRNDDTEVYITDGVTNGGMNVNNGTIWQSLFKVGITNTRYLRCKSANDNGFYSGIQTK